MMMSKCGDCCSTSKKLCPVSFGLAIGLVSFFAMLIWSLWIMTHGVPPMMADMPAPTLGSGFAHAILALIKGFIFGFFVALFYDLFACCFRKKSGEKCGCSSTGCGCKCGCGSSPELK